MRLRIYTLGRFCIYRDEDLLPAEAWKTQKNRALLKVLLTNRRRPIAREQLLEWLWPDLQPRAADRSLRIAVSQLRVALEPGLARGSGSGYILTTDSGYAWNVHGDYWLDADEFEAAAARFEQEHDLASAERARELYGGEYLEEDRYADWAAGERERLRELSLVLWTHLAEAQAGRGDYARAIALCRQVLAGDPCRESVWCQLMRYGYHAGDRALALRAYEECRQALADELQVEPLPQTRALYEQIVRDQVPALPLAVPNNLDRHTPLTPFVGREKELSRVTGLLRDPACRLLTLVGPGGMGKTRLALQAARQVPEPFPDGLHFVPLAAASSPDLVVSEIAAAVGCKLSGQQEPRLQLRAYLAGRRTLLVLDNFEQLLSGPSPELVLDLLQGAPESKCLVTSRERLNLQAEWLCQVGGLDYPAGRTSSRDPAADYAAVRLFVQTARRVQPGFSLPAERPHVLGICRALEGMPLGIELAAAATAESRCRDVAAHIARHLDVPASTLRDVPPRHRSLRAVFDWSWQLLSAPQRAAFRRLSVFQGGFSAAAAEQVSGAAPALLAALVRKSLLRQDPAGRYALHALLRHYLLERWEDDAAESEAVHAAHCAYYAGFVAEREDILRGPGQKAALEEIAAEMDNVRAAWQWAVARRLPAALNQCLEGLYLYYDLQSLLHEALAVFGHAVEELQPAGRWNDAEQARTLLGRLQARQAMFSYRLWQVAEARRLLHASIALLEAQQQPQELAFALYTLGYMEGAMEPIEQVAEGRRLLERSLALYRQYDDRWRITRVLNALGFVCARLGDLERAQRLHAEGLEIARAIGDRRTEAHHLDYWGAVAAELGDVEKAEELHRASLALFLEAGIQWGVAGASLSLAKDLCLLGRHREALAQGQETLALFRRLGIPYGIIASLALLGRAARALGETRAALQHWQQCLRETVDLELACDATALLYLAHYWAAAGRPAAALEAATAVLHQPNTGRLEREEAAQLCAEAAAQLPAEVAAGARARGSTKEPQEALLEVRRELQL